MKTLFLTAMLSALVSNHSDTQAIAKPDVVPEKCPSVHTLSSRGLDYTVPLFSSLWLAVKENSHYDTNDKWTFAIVGKSERNGKVALKQLSKDIGSLKQAEHPKWDDQLGGFVCEYEDAEGDTIAGAITPSFYG